MQKSMVLYCVLARYVDVKSKSYLTEHCQQATQM